MAEMRRLMKNSVTFYDGKPETLNLYDAVVEGLSRPRKSIPPKFFYDEVGSQLFEAICHQPEYYLPQAERRLLQRCASEIASLTGMDRIVIEPGAGNLSKVRLLLNELRPRAYVPMDISCEYLQWMSAELSQEYPWLAIHAACVDFSHSLPLPNTVPEGSRLGFFPGSSLGNFHPPEACDFLTMVRNTVGEDGMLLIGVDTKKPVEILDAAYNDAAGITARFNLNLLQRLRRELDADVDPDSFDHRAFYNADEGRIEMHLVSQRDQVIRVNGHRFHFAPGESVHTECSYKYTPGDFQRLAQKAGFTTIKHWLAEDGLFAVYLLEAAGRSAWNSN
jgi:dimethylhistidine N-methyltransferase